MKPYIKFLNYITVLLICIFSSYSACAAGVSKHDEFCPGEKITFEVRWAFVKAGEATLEVLPNEIMDGSTAYHFLYTAKTTKFVDTFYRIRDRIESYTDTDLTRSLLYKKRHESKRIKENTVIFDWDKKEAQSVSKGEVLNSIQLDENNLDPLSVFYAFRVGKPDKNNEITINLTDGKRSIRSTAKMLKKKKITVNGTKYNTILVEPVIEGVSGVFEKSKNAKIKIWVTDDKRRIPVRIKSKVTVGSFVADLISYTPGSEEDGIQSAQPVPAD